MKDTPTCSFRSRSNPTDTAVCTNEVYSLSHTHKHSSDYWNTHTKRCVYSRAHALSLSSDKWYTHATRCHTHTLFLSLIGLLKLHIPSGTRISTRHQQLQYQHRCHHIPPCLLVNRESFSLRQPRGSSKCISSDRTRLFAIELTAVTARGQKGGSRSR